jgi:hypothetical protein
MDGWRQFARVEARIKGELTKTRREVGLFCISASFIFFILAFSKAKTTLFDLYAYKKKMGRVSAGFTRIDQVSPGQLPNRFCLDPDWSHDRVGRVPDQPAGRVRVSKL